MVLSLWLGAALHATEPKLKIVTLNTVLTEIAHEVGGGNVEVRGLVRPGVDPHGFEPSAADLRVLLEADLILASGLQLEPYLDRLPEKIGARGRILKVGDALHGLIAAGDDHGHEGHGHASHDHGEQDPHWWHGIDHVIAAVALVRDELARQRPAEAGDFFRHAAAYEQRLQALKAWAGAEMAVIDPGSRHLVTSHDAFAYLARDYGLQVHAINGLSTDSEPSAKHLAALIRLIREKKIRAVFAENNVNPRVVANLIGETGVRAGGTLYADGFGPPGSDAITYEAMYRHNVRVIVEALRGR